MNKGLLVFGILNAIAGCVAGTYLVALSENVIWYTINGITGATSGIYFANLGESEK